MPRKRFKVHTKESGHGIYIVEAETAEEAEDIWTNGGVTEPDLLEMNDAEVDFTEEVDD